MCTEVTSVAGVVTSASTAFASTNSRFISAEISRLGGSTGGETDGDINHFTWNASDASNLSSLLVTIKRNGVILLQTNALADSTGSFNFDSLGLGTYDIT